MGESERILPLPLAAVNTQTEQPASWHDDRRLGIFATDVGPILRLCRFGRGPLDIAVEKILGIRRTRPNASMRVGKYLEPLIGSLYEEETSHSVIPAPTAKKGWMGAHGDFLAIDGAAQPTHLVEAKATGDRRGWGEPGSDRVPADILLQCQWQMACYDLPRCDVAVLFHLSEFAIYPIHRHDGLIERVAEVCGEFWGRCLRRVFPEHSWEDPRTAELIPLLYRPDGKTVVALGEDALTLADEMITLGQSINTIDKLRQEKKARLTVLMGTAQVGLLPDGLREVRRAMTQVKAHQVVAREQVTMTICKAAKGRQVT